MSRLLVVSNRVAGERDAGGLAVAMRAALRGQEALWFGWSGKRGARHTGDLERRRLGNIEIATLDLDEADVAAYYDGYANATLWPVFHSRIDLAAHERAFSDGYARVNRLFAQALAPLVRPDDRIWVHDYHLIPLATELRRLGVTAPIGFFLHVPWPARQLFTTLPRHRELAEAMFAYDLVGFQTQDCLDAFEAYVLNEGNGVRRAGQLGAFGTTLKVGAFPIGLDADDFQALSRSPEALRTCDRMIAHGIFRNLIVGVDRLDYSKGLPERLEGFEHFLAENPEMVRKVLYLQIAPGSRETVEAYQTLRAKVLALAGRINAAWGEMDHAPMLCVSRNYSRAELAGIYRAARIGLVTPLADGMNLVAKEYVAAQDPQDPGVLILSHFAGAARQMKEALIVNPYSREEMADALRVALRMDIGERRARWEALMAGVTRFDVLGWRDDFLAALDAVRAAPAPETPTSRLSLEALNRGMRLSQSPSPARGSAVSAAIWPTPTAG